MQHDITAAIRAVLAGQAPWQAVLDAQHAQYPSCTAHGVATPMILDDTPLCVQCIAEQGEAIRARLQSLFPGGAR